jgi:response regulator RpfG family c-di-GMP phosphodiesterase
VTNAILCVDDEKNMLDAYRRMLEPDFTIVTADCGDAALALMAQRGPFAVIVSDLHMPGMSGVQLLAITRERYPDTVRVLLTGGADLEHAIQAVNDGYLFRFLTKPCSRSTLVSGVTAAVAQYLLITAERELLDKTVRGCVQILGEVLAIVNPTAFGRAVRVQRLIKGVATLIDGAGSWEVDVSVVLSQLGCIAIPESVMNAAARGADLPDDQRKQLDTQVRISLDLLRRIPRFEQVIEIVAYQNKPFDSPAWYGLEKSGKSIPLGSRLLRIGFDFDTLVCRGVPERQAFANLASKASTYDPEVFAAIRALIEREALAESREVAVGELVRGMVLAQDVHSDTGILLLGRGHPITDAVGHRLQAMAARGDSPLRIRVIVPQGSESR